MASPSVVATEDSVLGTAGTSHTVDLPASIASGDLLIALFGYSVGVTDPGLAAVTWPAGWTAISGFQTERTTVCGADAAYRQADGTEGATITVTTDVTTKSAHQVYRITGHENPTTQAPQAGTGVTGLSVNADPPTLSPTGGSKDYLFLAVALHDGSAANVFTAFPTNYTDGIQIGAAGGGAVSTQCKLASARRALTASSDDPGTFTLDTSTSWVAQTIAIHPAGAGGQTVTGSLFTKAPTFFTGAITATYNLAGTLFTKAPSFFTGTVTATRTLTGVLFTKAPTFPTGAVSLAAGPQTVNGVLFTKAPTFPQGAVTSTYALTGTLFVKAPTFFTGTVTSGAVTLTGALFVKAPTFPQGTVTAGAVSLTGVLFQKAPTFPTGTVTAGAYPLTGTLFVKAPTFFAGTIGQAGTLFGTLFQKAPTFFTGSLTSGAPSFWQPDPAGWTANPAAFVRVGRFGPSPWGAELSGQRFEKAPTFPVGTVS